MSKRAHKAAAAGLYSTLTEKMKTPRKQSVFILPVYFFDGNNCLQYSTGFFDSLACGKLIL